MKILDEIDYVIRKLTVSGASIVAVRARKLYGSPIYECGEELHKQLKDSAEACGESFYAPCGENLGKAVNVCPAFVPAIDFNDWKEKNTQKMIDELNAKITRLEDKLKDKPGGKS